MLVFPAFQALDVFGPLDALNLLSLSYTMNLAIIAQTLDPVSTKPLSAAMNAHNSSFGERVVPTHTFENPPADLEVLFVPGGLGTRAPADQLQPVFDYIKSAFPSLKYVITVCTGATLAARSSILDGRTATTNKRSWVWATSTGPKTNWIAHARWIDDGKVWSSSGVSAGIDATIAWIAHIYGNDVAQGITDGMEHTRVRDWRDDPFAALYNCTDVPPKA
jgi:transcriptional regulator GlxA family with amidase domain